MTTHYYTATSLDGFIASKDHSLDWLFRQEFDPEGPMGYPGFIKNIGALVLGASTYEWVRQQQDEWVYEEPTWIFSHRDLPTPKGKDVRVVQGEINEVFPQIEASAGDKDIWVMGGGDLAGQFADAQLLDEVWVQYAPVTLGTGAPLLPRQLQLDLVDTVQNRSFVCARYQVNYTAV
ncbi:dihydrofolate reductase family protein [Citricoccus muralis]|uniref:Dihydrofolate reductase family protein n=1 Tax=Citricoccus muralis TaxID=169134 RepID=A0ABY8H6X5_9MICC|nr:dihydrofolate reductase family protein [Citricoccus muralis]WFP16899.1 dihydrofolate reductase family protein [Citricoccus muralis]